MKGYPLWRYQRNFMDKTFLLWCKYQSHSFKMKCAFIYDNALSYASNLTHEFFDCMRFTGVKIMEWPDLNPIKNLWSILKINLFEDGKQYDSKVNLWEAIKTTMLEIESAEVKTLIKSLDNELPVVIEQKGHYIKM